MGLIASAATTALGAGVQYNETRRTNRRQDQEAAASIRRQGQLQQQADRVVSDEVGKLAASDSNDERAQRLDQYMQVLRRGQRQANSGLEGPVGGASFQADAGAARDAADAAAATTAGLQARIDAPGLQRQGEAFNYGRLATDLGLIGRESAGQSFVDQLRMQRIRRRPEVDLLAGAISGAGQLAQPRPTATGGSTQQFGNNLDALGSLPGASRGYGRAGGRYG
ncbi:TPA: hypothetical protein RNT23_002105 [Stenotrophomonas maltophilia]|nr:hypothetical protein [Stenotrophomonas maltophilia]